MTIHLYYIQQVDTLRGMHTIFSGPISTLCAFVIEGLDGLFRQHEANILYAHVG